MKSITLVLIACFAMTIEAKVVPEPREDMIPDSEMDRIWNGTTSRKGLIPWQVLLSIKRSDGTYLCGGSLISDRWVVTAAHCTKDADYVVLKFGIVDAYDTTGVSMNSTEHYEHPDYDSKKIKNDIAFVKLPQAIQENDNIREIKLPRKAWAGVDTYNGITCVASGWGNTRNNQVSNTRYMQYAYVKVTKQSTCRNYYSNVNEVGDKEICTSNFETETGTCSGDSGGPLIISYNREYHLIGVVSWGINACETGYPSVYVNLASYLDYLNEVTGIAVQ